MAKFHMSPEDQSFGPQLPGHFDFTLYFEHAILTVLPTAAFLVGALVYIVQMQTRPTVVGTGWLFWTKMVRKTAEAIYEIPANQMSTDRKRLTYCSGMPSARILG